MLNYQRVTVFRFRKVGVLPVIIVVIIHFGLDFSMKSTVQKKNWGYPQVTRSFPRDSHGMLSHSGSECHKHREDCHAPSHQFTSFGVPCSEPQRPGQLGLGPDDISVTAAECDEGTTGVVLAQYFSEDILRKPATDRIEHGYSIDLSSHMPI